MKEGPYFEDLPVGTVLETGTFEMTRDAIVGFAEQYDPQPFHLGEKSAENTFFGRLVASGWHTAAVTMRLLVESGHFGTTGLVGAGVDELRWPKPVIPGDVLRVRTEVVENSRSSSGKRARIRWATTTLNQRGEAVFTMTSITLFPGRPTQA
jgi:acyl dehydratase